MQSPNISIHAPVKGATTSKIQSSGTTTHFNPRTREGCDVSRFAQTGYRDRISIHAPVKGATYNVSGK